MNGAEALVAILEELDVRVVFGLSGDTSLPLYRAFSDSGRIRHVLTRDERSASFMADAYARLSGRVGVCEGPSGGGATYILPGVAEANGSSVPLVCLTTDISVGDRGRGTLTELDQQALFTPVTRRSLAPTRSEDLPRALRTAFREATTGGLGACHLSVPMDVQSGPADPERSPGGVTGSRYPAERLAPAPDAVRAAAGLLVRSRRPVLVAGAGVLRSGAWDELGALSRALGAPVATSIGGKGAIAETDPLSLGVIGSNGGLPWRHAFVRDADLVLFVGGGTGSVTTEKGSLPGPGGAAVLQLDPDPDMLGRNHRLAAALACDARLGLTALLEEVTRLGAEEGRTDPELIGAARRAHEEEVAPLFASGERPVRPERLVAELGRRLPADAIVLADAGTPCPYLSAYLPLPRAGRWFVSPRAFGALGYALPASVGAALARPEAGRVVAVMGDGSFGISAGELETLVRLALPLTLIVCNNAGYGWIKAGQKSRGDPYWSVDLLDVDHALVARAYGMRAHRVEDPAELGPALDEALAEPGPYLLDVVTQPLEEARAPVSKWIA